MSQLLEQFAAARRASTPLMAIWTAEPAALVEGIAKSLPGDTPILQWDLVRGIRGLGQTGVAVANQLVNGEDPAAVSGVPTDALRLLAKAPRGTVTFYLNGSRYWDAPDVAQGIWNLRDAYASTKRCLVVVGADGSRIPAELTHDVTVLRDPLPSRAQIEGIITKLHVSAKPKALPVPSGREMDRIVDTLSGLSAFAVEQVVSMSLTASGVALDALRARRRQAIENTDGLTVYSGSESFASLGGLAQIKKFFLRLRDAGREPIKCIAFVDELDKAMAGAGYAGGAGDNTGISQDQLRQLLTNIQDTGSKGAMLYGVPGTGKTAFGKALANELGVEFLQWDLGAMMDSAAGSSQKKIRAACDVTNAVGQGATLYLATCNSTATLPTELRRRFRAYGEWFFDLPQADETPSITAIYLKKYGLTVTGANPLPDLTEWTGAEIQSLCYLAYNLDLPFVEAADFVVPMRVSGADVVKRLRQAAAGRFLSTSAPGKYAPPLGADLASPAGRTFTLEDAAASVVLGGMKES